MRREQSRASKVLGMSILIALFLVALGATSAQAAEWTVGGKALKELTTKEALTLGAGSLTHVGLGPFSVHCGSGHSHTTVKESGISNGTIEFLSCEVQDPKGNSAAETCKVNETIALKAKGLLSKDAMYDVFSSESGAVFTTVTVENVIGQKCQLIKESPEKFEVTGTLGALVSGNALLFSEAIAVAAETKLKFGSLTASVEGTIKQELLAPYEGLELGAVK
jgi:hypothetical protein